MYIHTVHVITYDSGVLHSQATNSTTSTSLPSERGENSGNNGHSTSPGDSVALMIQVTTRDIQCRLEAACGLGVVDVFCTTGRRKTIFPTAYQEYGIEVAKMEDNVSRYLKVQSPSYRCLVDFRAATTWKINYYHKNFHY